MGRTEHACTDRSGQIDLFDRPPGARERAGKRDRGAKRAGPDTTDPTAAEAEADRVQQMARLHRALDLLAFTPLPDGVRSTADAFYVFGWHERVEPDGERLGKRFRDLAMIFHPDTGVLPSAAHMAQLIDARDLLVRQFGKSRRSRLADILARSSG